MHPLSPPHAHGVSSAHMYGFHLLGVRVVSERDVAPGDCDRDPLPRRGSPPSCSSAVQHTRDVSNQRSRLKLYSMTARREPDAKKGIVPTVPNGMKGGGLGTSAPRATTGASTTGTPTTGACTAQEHAQHRSAHNRSMHNRNKHNPPGSWCTGWEIFASANASHFLPAHGPKAKQTCSDPCR